MYLGFARQKCIRTLLKDQCVAFLQAKQQQDDFGLEIEDELTKTRIRDFSDEN